MYDDLASIEEGLAALVGRLDPSVLHGRDALTALERACRITKLATTAAMLLGRRVDETDAWKPSGRPSAAHLLANLSGISLGDATAMLGTAKKMERLPKTGAAARRGKLSAKQASEVSRGAAADPAAEDDLLGLAEKGSTSELTDESRRRRHAAAGDDARRHARMKARRALHRFADDDGSAVLRWRHLPEVGAELDTILADYVDDEFTDARREGRREERSAYAADALVAALRDAAAFRRGESIDDEDIDASEVDEEVELDIDLVDTPTDADAPVDTDSDSDSANDAVGEPVDIDTSGDADVAPDGVSRPAGTSRHDLIDDPLDHHPGSEPAGSNRRSRRRDGERGSRRRRRKRRRGADAKVIVRVDLEALRRGFTEPGEVCDIAGIGPVPVTSVAALLDDAFVAAVITQGRDVLTATHLGRRPNALQETAMQAAGVRCAVLGCPNTHRLQRDHEEDWARTHHTRLDELDWLCEHDHDLKTHRGYRLVPGRGPREFLSPEQRRLRGARTDHPPGAPPRATRPRPQPAGPGSSTGRVDRRSGLPVGALTLDL